MKPLISGKSPVAVCSRGRACGQGGCETILSIYNPTSYCSLHEHPQLAVAHPKRRDGNVVEKACAFERCGENFETSNAKRIYCNDRCRMAAFELRRRQERAG
jgi:hypothetical protein